MKQLFVVIVFILVLGGGYTYYKNSLKDESRLNNTTAPTASPSILPTITSTQRHSKAVFVPYWTFNKTEIRDTEADTFIYFGITVNEKGIDTTEEGYKKIKAFILLTESGKDKILTIRMINSEINAAILKNKALQDKIISESIRLARLNDFNGLLLDFETSSLPLDSVVQNINAFMTSFGKKVKEENLPFYITMYGDAFYRFRPFNIKDLAAKTDGIYIMAYDFHKARGNSGPNFPLKGKEKYGYDYKTMLDDFLNVTSPEKVIVVFGMFGYDWTVDEKGLSRKNAESLSYLELKKKFITSCVFIQCKVNVDEISSETNVTYLDGDKNNHSVWFESPDSMRKKTQLLNSMGIFSTAIWAYSYY